MRDVFAGAIVAVLHEMLREFWVVHNARKSQWKRLGPHVAGYSVPQILSAALENFRKYEQWDAAKAEEIAEERSVKVLSAVLGLPLKKNAKRLPFRGNVCWSVLDTLTDGTGYARLDNMVREFAEQLEACHTS